MVIFVNVGATNVFNSMKASVFFHSRLACWNVYGDRTRSSTTPNIPIFTPHRRAIVSGDSFPMDPFGIHHGNPTDRCISLSAHDACLVSLLKRDARWIWEIFLSTLKSVTCWSAVVSNERIRGVVRCELRFSSLVANTAKDIQYDWRLGNNKSVHFDTQVLLSQFDLIQYPQYEEIIPMNGRRWLQRKRTSVVVEPICRK